MKNKIQTLLQMDSFDYDLMLFGMWSRWVESVTVSQLEYQKVLCNVPVNRWYNMELAKLENQFLNEASTSPNASLELIQECYNDITFKMENIFPKPLLEAAKRCENKGYQSLHGIKIETKIFNQN